MTKQPLQPTDESVDAFLELDPEMAEIDAFIAGVLPNLSRVLWRGVFWGGREHAVIAYGNVTLRIANGTLVDWFPVGLVRQKSHFSLFARGEVDGEAVTKRYEPVLGKAKASVERIAFRSFADVAKQPLRSLLLESIEISERDHVES